MTYVLTGRKTWKTLKENQEAVWPPYIEAVLLEGLLYMFLGTTRINTKNSSRTVSPNNDARSKAPIAFS